jgi:multidrug resistance efflux pump
MPPSRKGHAMPASWRFLTALTSAVLAFALFNPTLGSAQEVKQIKLTEKHIQSFIAASEEISTLSDGDNQDNGDQKLEQVEALVKKYGFVNMEEFDDISTNISMIISGIDQQTRKFTEPKEQIRQQIAAIKSDKSIPEAEKKEDLAQLDAALREAKPIQFKENITLVLKHFDKLFQLMQEERPGN